MLYVAIKNETNKNNLKKKINNSQRIRFMESLDLKKMLDAGLHFGHRTSRWSPKMNPYIWGARNKVHLLDVSKTAFLLERAGKFLKESAAQGKSVLFVGTKKPAQEITSRNAQSVQMPFVIHRWVGGTLSNYEQVKKAITRLLHLKDVIAKPLIHYKKKEIGMLQKEVARLEKNVGGIIELDFPPAALIVIDAKKEATAVKEALRLRIPVVAIVDTNTDPDGISYLIPANDDSPRSIDFVVTYLTQALAEGKAAFNALPDEEKKALIAANKPARTMEAPRKSPNRGGGDRNQGGRSGSNVRRGRKPADGDEALPTQGGEIADLKLD